MRGDDFCTLCGQTGPIADPAHEGPRVHLSCALRTSLGPAPPYPLRTGGHGGGSGCVFYERDRAKLLSSLHPAVLQEAPRQEAVA